MKDAIEIKTEEIKSLAKRKNYLTTQYEKTLPDEIPKKVKRELELIDAMFEDADVSEDIYQSMPKTINIKNSRDEEWYFQQIEQWAVRHPQATNGQFGRSTLYRFALHFFVENIVLSSTNASLTYDQVVDKVKYLSVSKSENIQIQQNRNIENSLAFLTAMMYQALNYIPESISDEKYVNYAINPFESVTLKNLDVDTTLKEDSELGKAFGEFTKILSRDKQRLKKINKPTGEIDDD